MITVHGRTRACGYQGQRRLRHHRPTSRRASSLPVVANGDIDSPEKAREVLAYRRRRGHDRPRRAGPAMDLFGEIDHFLAQRAASCRRRHGRRSGACCAQHLLDHYAFLWRIHRRAHRAQAHRLVLARHASAGPATAERRSTTATSSKAAAACAAMLSTRTRRNCGLIERTRYRSSTGVLDKQHSTRPRRARDDKTTDDPRSGDQQPREVLPGSGGTKPALIYDMVLSAVEKPMLEVVMTKADGNQLQRLGDARHQPQYAAQEAAVLRIAQRPRRPSSPSGSAAASATDARTAGPPRADQRLRQDRRRTTSPARSPPLGVEILSTGGTANRPADAQACRSPRSRTTPASRRCSTAASRRCTRRSTAACWRAATSPEHVAKRCSAHGIAHDRPAGGQPLSVPADRGHARTARSTMRSRTSTSAARPCCAPRPRTTTRVAVVVRPGGLRAPCSAQIEATGASTRTTRFTLATKVFAHTAQLRRRDHQLPVGLRRLPASTPRARAIPQTHQLAVRARCRRCATARTRTRRPRSTASSSAGRGALANYRQLQGKELSYNNIADADAAWECVKSLRRSRRCVIVKHANPCGVAIGRRPAGRLPARVRDRSDLGVRRHHRLQPAGRRKRAVALARAVRRGADRARSRSPSGRAIGVDECGQAERAPAADPAGPAASNADRPEAGRRRPAGAVARRRTAVGCAICAWSREKQPDPAAAGGPACSPGAWPHFVKSNAIVFCGDGQTLGVGAGQMSRVDSARIASIKAANAGLDLAGSAVASDAFFPFRDGLDVVVDAGATCRDPARAARCATRK